MMTDRSGGQTENTAGGTIRHIPVMLEEVLDALSPKDNEIYIDGTFGAGGYAAAFLEAAECSLLGIDRDPDVIRDAAPLLETYKERLALTSGTYDQMAELAENHFQSKVDGVVLDIGVSSMQIDQAERGFSFSHDGPLDMRMSRAGKSAADVINTYSETQLADIFYHLGEERKSRPIARRIVKRRTEAPIETTRQLASIVEEIIPLRQGQTKHPATRVFQALRIYVNDELGQLERGLRAAENILKPGGRLVVVTFHSLEDRLVKNFMRQRAGLMPGRSRHLPEINEETLPSFQIINRKSVKPSEAEVMANPRARSALLRVAIRTDASPGPHLEGSLLGMPPLEL